MDNLYIHNKHQKGQKPADIYMREMNRLRKMPQKRLSQEPTLFLIEKQKPSWDNTNSFINDFLKTPTSQNFKRQSLPIVLPQNQQLNESPGGHGGLLQSSSKLPELCRMSINASDINTSQIAHEEWLLKPPQEQWTRQVVKSKQFEYGRLHQSSKQRLQRLRALGDRRQNLTLEYTQNEYQDLQQIAKPTQTEQTPTQQRVFSVVKLNQTMYNPSNRNSPIQVKQNPQQSYSRPPSSETLKQPAVPRSTQSSQLKLFVTNADSSQQKNNHTPQNQYETTLHVPNKLTQKSPLPPNLTRSRIPALSYGVESDEIFAPLNDQEVVVKNNTADGVSNKFFYDRNSPQPAKKKSQAKKQSLLSVHKSTQGKTSQVQPDNQNFQRLITSGDLSQELRMLEDRIKVINLQSRRGSKMSKTFKEHPQQNGSPDNQVSQSILRPQQTKIYRIIGESSSTTGLSCQMDSNCFAPKTKKKVVNFQQDIDD